MKTQNIIYIIIIGLLLLYLYCKKKNKKINNNIYNPFIITKNQERLLSDLYNKEKINNINNKTWIGDDITLKRCYNLCQNNYLHDYTNCVQYCNKFKTF